MFTPAQQMYTYYTIATVETGCNYSAVNQSDPITLGILQWFGLNAYNYVLKPMQEQTPDYYAMLSQHIKDKVDQGQTSWGAWSNFYLINDDAASFALASESEAVHELQDQCAILYLFGTGDGGTYGAVTKDTGNTDVKSIVFLMSMYHQSQAATRLCMQTLGPNQSIETLRNWCFSNTTFSPYKNRYNKVYDLLASWDGVSMPPDFGQSDELLPGGDPGGSISSGTLQNTIGYIQQTGDDLVVYGPMGSTGSLLCRNTGRGVWLPVQSTAAANPGAGSPSGGEAPPASPDDPADFPAMRQLWYDHANQWNYGQGDGRLDPVNSGYSDCSACIYWAANAATNNKYSEMGKWTGAMLENCHVVWECDGAQEIPIDVLRPGDLIIFDYTYGGYTDHVEWYFGNGVVWGAGGAPLPHKTTDDVTQLLKIWSEPIAHAWVCRFLE